MSPEEQRQWRVKMTTRVSTVNDLAERAMEFLAPGQSRTLLDLGCGEGLDSIAFAKNGFRVTSLDFSYYSLGKLAANREGTPSIDLVSVHHDLREPLPFRRETFDVVYAHNSVHFFLHKDTVNIFHEIHRVLKKGGVFFLRCKSDKDPIYGTGIEIEDHVYKRKIMRHFFSKEYLQSLLKPFKIESLKHMRSVFWGDRIASYDVIAIRPKD
jgi:SAM-dependent methyltransferase